jgi:3-oxoacyl-[acyl-carrier protein] reductase
MTNKLDDNQIENLLKSIPLKRLGTIDDVVSSTLFLSSDLASYITGETIHVNGGMFMS